jgi:CheY-like chemotaxis protein
MLAFWGQSGYNDRREKRALAGETMLLVDDESRIAELAALSLEREGFRVQSAGDGSKALEVVEAHGGTVAAKSVVGGMDDALRIFRRRTA